MNIIIFAGGVGTRLWPLSRKKTPKQFGKIIGGQSTLQQTIDRLKPDFSEKDIYVATGERYREIVTQQLPDLDATHFIFEPDMRDVGPAIGLAAYTLAAKDPQTPIAILWSDHMVKRPEVFRKMLVGAEHLVEEGKAKFVYLAQKPRFANQNMGWIHVGEQLGEEEGVPLYAFEALKYRPSPEEAQQFMDDGAHLWNLGYFVTTPAYLVSLYEQFAPEIAEKLSLISEKLDSAEFDGTLKDIYPTFPKVSFDDLILQKMSPDHISVLAEDVQWSDVGAWESLKEALQETKEDNVTHGNNSLVNTKDSLVFNYEDKLVVGIDLEGMVIVNTEDTLLICPAGSIPKVKKFVESLEGTENEHLA